MNENSFPSFSKRFNIPVNVDEEKRRFFRRLTNGTKLSEKLKSLIESPDAYYVKPYLQHVANVLGEDYWEQWNLHHFVGEELYKLLKALEATYDIAILIEDEDMVNAINYTIDHAFQLNEIDIGITWKAGAFWPSGAKLLDEELVNRNLEWLASPEYRIVAEPFTKGLRHFLESQAHPQRLTDVITDIYEALEAMGKIIVNNDADLSENKERFVKALKLSNQFKSMLSEYIDYGCEYRHAPKKGTERPLPKRNEVEAFIYMTGLFIRLAIQQLEQQR